MARKSEKSKIAKALGASRVVRAGKRWKDWMMASSAEKKLCVCGTANKHLPHCPYDEIGVDFSDLQRVLKELEKDCAADNKPRDPKRIPKILKRLGKLWTKFPHLRLIQLLENPFPVDGVRTEYYLEDEKLISDLEKFYRNFNTKKNRR